MKRAAPTSLQFFGRLRWLDRSPLLDRIEDYRREIFRQALDTYEGKPRRPRFNLVLCGRGKKNWKSADLILAALYCLLIRRSPLGNDGLIVASDEGQAKDDLEIARRLVDANPVLSAEIEVLAKELRLRDGSGSLRIIPGRDIAGAHGKTYAFLGIDELHTSRSWDLLEALAPDPTRTDALRWITSYDTIYNTAGVPLFDLKQLGKAGTEPRMLFSWYSGGELCTDPAFADLEPELRANPSFGSWPEGRAYLDQERRTLPTHRYRRLHLNLPGAPEGAVFDQGKVMACVVPGRRSLPYVEGIVYFCFVDMCGGGPDDAVICIGHEDNGRVIIDRIEQQAGSAADRFNPLQAVCKFFGIMREYRISHLTLDGYAGRTFHCDFESYGVTAWLCRRPKAELYDQLEPAINAGVVELPDDPKLLEQILTLVHRGGKIDHENGGHDDYANAVAGCVSLIRPNVFQEKIPITVPGYAANGAWVSEPRVLTDAMVEDGTARANAARPPDHYLADYQRQNEPWRGYVDGGYCREVPGAVYGRGLPSWWGK